MKLLAALLEELMGSKQADGETFRVSITMVSSTMCSHISRFSTAGGDETSIIFKPPLPLEEALLHSRKYDKKGTFTHE